MQDLASLDAEGIDPKLEASFNRFTPALASGTRETENCPLILDAQSPVDLKALVTARLIYFNVDRRDSTSGYQVAIITTVQQ